MKNLFKLAVPTIVAAVATLSTAANAAVVQFDLEDVTNGGGFFSKVTITDTVAGTVRIVADIADPINLNLSKGDIVELGLGISDASLLSGMAYSNAVGTGTDGSGNDITIDPLTFADTCFSENNCDVFSGGGNQGKGFDMSFQFGQGGGRDGTFFQTVEFDLSSVGLTATAFLNQDAGLRVQSIEGVSTFTKGSSKLAGDGDPAPSTVPEPSSLALLALGLAGVCLSRRKLALRK